MQVCFFTFPLCTEARVLFLTNDLYQSHLRTFTFSAHCTEEEPYHGEGEELNPFEQLQAERESEFLGALIEPLSMLPEEYAQYATNDLGDRLRQTVSAWCGCCLLFVCVPALFVRRCETSGFAFLLMCGEHV